MKKENLSSKGKGAAIAAAAMAGLCGTDSQLHAGPPPSRVVTATPAVVSVLNFDPFALSANASPAKAPVVVPSIPAAAPAPAISSIPAVASLPATSLPPVQTTPPTTVAKLQPVTVVVAPPVAVTLAAPPPTRSGLNPPPPRNPPALPPPPPPPPP